MIPVNIKHKIKLTNHYQILNDKSIKISVPDKLRKCQDLAYTAIYENILLRHWIHDLMNDEKEYQNTILELDNIIHGEHND